MTTSRSRPSIAGALISLVALCILIGLGVWQVQRLKWKTGLLHRIDALQHAPPEPIDAVLRRIPDHLDVSFSRVQLDCPQVQATPVERLFSEGPDGDAGYRMITACTLATGPFGSILVDRGFVPQSGEAAPTVAPGPSIAEPVVGVLRAPDKPSFAAAQNQPAQHLWYWRDLAGMAASLKANRPAPVFLMLESPAPRAGLPRPAPLPANIPNNHLGYAITWFGLAAALAGVYLALLFRKRPD